MKNNIPMTDESNLWTILNWLSPGSAPHRKQQAFDLITLHTEEREIEIRLNENSMFWSEANDMYHGIPIDTNAWWYIYHMARIAQLTNPTERSE